MTTNKRLGTEPSKITDKDSAYGVKLDPGPYIGTIKNNTDPARAGRVQVWIPEFGGKETDQSSWITVGYASPYMGATRWPRETKEKCDGNEYGKVNHSYGMWMTPPDVGNFVMVTFVGGNANQGYYFASIMKEHTQHAVPAIAGSNSLTGTTVDPALGGYLDKKPYPCVEFNEVNKELHPMWNKFLAIPKPPHEYQNLRLLKEGLEDDKARGVISSSSQRESPSRVFGISTPGREGSQIPPEEQNGVKGPGYRLGGHTFVMDDGSVDDINRVVRLRTARGHQIIMSDHEKKEKDFIYVGNAEGTAWIEIMADGQMQFYAENSVSWRTKADFNMYIEGELNIQTKTHMNLFSDGSICMEADQITNLAYTELHLHSDNVAGIKAGGDLFFQSSKQTHLNASKEIIMSAGGNLSLKSDANLLTTAAQIHLNGPAAPTAKRHDRPGEFHHCKHREIIPTAPAPYYKWKPDPEKVFLSTVPILPKHEPSNSKNRLCCGSFKNGHGGVIGCPVYVLLDQVPNPDLHDPPPPVGEAPWNSECWPG